VNGAPAVVVDASVALKWLVAEPDSPAADALAQSWARAGLSIVAPYLFGAEISNVLHQLVRRKLLSADGALALLIRLTAFRIVYVQPPGINTRALLLADALGLPAAYDAHYLALAESMGCELWTADAKFQRQARERFPRIRLLAEHAA